MKNAVFYDNPVPTNRKHHASPTEPNRLMLYKISGFHDGDYDECRFMGCGAVWDLLDDTFLAVASYC
jgi:hypothetical protein